MKTRHPRTPGFTLTELLVVITIIIVLAALVFPLTKKFIQYANGVRDMATMRQLFNNIPIYASDHSGTLPGPINTGQKSLYGPASTGRISYYVAEYLGYTNPKNNEFLPAMAYTWQRDDAARDAPCAFIRETVPLADGSGNIRPFGHPLRSGADRIPKSMAAVITRIEPSRTWIISDLDQQHPDVGSAAWRGDIPEEMSHGNYRTAIFFDGHAGKLNKDNDPF